MLKTGIRSTSIGDYFIQRLPGNISMLVVLMLNFSCLSDPDTTDKIPGIPEKSISFTCQGTYFVRKGQTGLDNCFFIGDSPTSFFTFSENHLYKYDIKTLEVIRDRSFLPQEISKSYYAPRDQHTGWLLVQNKSDDKWTAHVVDTLGNTVSSVGIEPDKNDNNGYVIATTPDLGFVLAASPSTTVNPDQYTVYRYSDAGALLWKKTLMNKGRIASVLALRNGGFLVGGSNFSTTQPTYNSFLARLDDDGNEKWQEVKHLGNLTNAFSIDYLMEDDTTDYFILLRNQGNSLSLVRSDSAYQIKWTRPIDNQVQFTPPGMQAVKNDILVYYSGGSGLAGSFNIGFASITSKGDIRWTKNYGGTGDEVAYAMRYQELIGYSLIGRTDNWDGVNALPVSNSYVIKTDLTGSSCR